ncbi:Elongation of very long chain fatty acids protein 4 [Bulinus truncatus]|nr:Elongation of very long chain fatty acids protein 4 [Bulinus truncatus]
MEEIVGTINEKYNLTPSEVYYGDDRVSDWLFMNNLASVLSIVFFYLLMVKHGPAFMEKRDPMNLSFLLVIYNFVLVILSLYMSIEMVVLAVRSQHSILCHPVNTDLTESGMREASIAWWYFISKIVELLDTVFFILRKKNNQLSFLHVYHHTSMVLICWYVAKYLPGGEKLYSGSLNSLVHVVMYTYYALSAMGPQLQKYLWWKRYLTEFQMVQFVCVNLRCIGTFFNSHCDYPPWVNAFTLMYASSQLLLFLNFYMKAYKSNGVKSSRTQSNGAQTHTNFLIDRAARCNLYPRLTSEKSGHCTYGPNRNPCFKNFGTDVTAHSSF